MSRLISNLITRAPAGGFQQIKATQVVKSRFKIQ